MNKYNRSLRMWALALATCSALWAEPSEKVVYIQCGFDDTPNLNEVNNLLADGWTVKHQSAAAGGGASYFLTRTVLLFTLTPPPPEVLAKREEEKRIAREAAFAKKREEYLKSKQVEKP